MILATIAALSIAPFQSANSLDNTFRDALGVAGLNTSTAQYDQKILSLFVKEKFAPQLFTTTHQDIWRTPFYFSMYKRALSDGLTDHANLFSTAGRMVGYGSRRSLLGDPIAAAEERANKTGALNVALQELVDQGLAAGPINLPSNLPMEVQRAAALILETAIDTVPHRRASFAALNELDPSFLGDPAATDDPQDYQQFLDVYEQVSMHHLAGASQDMAAATARASELLQSVPSTASYSFVFDTAWGEIVLAGGGSDTYEYKERLLIIDTSGSDVYVNNSSTQSASNWLSVTIDTDGNDKYVSDKALLQTAVAQWPLRKSGGFEPGPASAQFGVAILIDTVGDDLYRTHKPGLGSATFGVAWLYDQQGNDTYDAYRNSQGFGRWGIGILQDDAGKDEYRGFSQVQGCGLTSGFGGLFDSSGDDLYEANDSVIDFPSPQTAEHNVSMSQGAGYGVRHDYLSGISLSGGIGILHDLKGDDQYTCGVFGQGTGYWQSIGALWDDDGTDSYTGVWYVQGAAAHFATGYLEDSKGNDTYIATMNMAQGAGHDFSTGYLLDHEGDDSYTAPNLSLGGGNANGVGVLYEGSGNDKYESRGTTLGKANRSVAGSIRERALCLGIFIDMGGRDTYPGAASWAGNGERVRNVTDLRPTPGESQLGIFFDR